MLEIFQSIIRLLLPINRNNLSFKILVVGSSDEGIRGRERLDISILRLPTLICKIKEDFYFEEDELNDKTDTLQELYLVIR